MSQTEHVFTCERCRAKADGIYNDDPLPMMAGLGWHNLEGRWLCSKACAEWFVFLAKREAAQAAIQPVMAIGDRAYQTRRGAAQAPGLTRK